MRGLTGSDLDALVEARIAGELPADASPALQAAWYAQSQDEARIAEVQEFLDLGAMRGPTVAEINAMTDVEYDAHLAQRDGRSLFEQMQAAQAGGKDWAP